MAYVFPFKGIIYDKKYFSKDIMAPPYDVITPTQKEKLKEKNTFNIVNLTLPSSYDKASQTLNEWLKRGILKFDNECCFYSYKCLYEIEGEKKQLNGFIAALKVEEFGGSIKPHEKTLKGPKIDRFNLITKTHAMFCPIMGLYKHEEKINEILSDSFKKEPVFKENFEDADHILCKITDKKQIEIIQDILKNQSIIIADGHHRYETAIMIKKFFNEQNIKEGGFEYIMILLIDSKSGGLSLQPIHRLVKKVEDHNEFLEKLKKYFYIKQKNDNDWDFSMYTKGKFLYLKLKEKKEKNILEKLDVSIFEKYIYKEILNLTDEDIKNQHIAGYAHSKKEVIDMVDNSKADIGFILKPMSFEELVQITEKGLTVPQKSTFFHPKIPSGLVGYHFKSIEGCKNV